MTREQRWLRTQRANAKRSLRMTEKVARALPAGSVKQANAELATIERVIQVVDVYAAAGGFRRIPR